jgi:tRNA-specific 2-thiouridylase
MARVVVGLSGGVDSAVAALLLKQQGHTVTGLFMKNWEEDDTAGQCSAEEDLKVVRAVCTRLAIPLQTVNFAAEYWDRVFHYFLEEHKAGRTPNPDVLCNKEIKFSAFLEHALGLGAEYIATGHYAQVRAVDGTYQLLKGTDTNKDQSYFLYTLGQAQLARTLFPVGHLEKPAVRALARAAGLANAERKDSTGICFIGERDFRDFLRRYLPAQPGEIRTLDGEPKGRHEGVMYYTLGQRQGLGIGGAGEPWYVVDKDIAHNILYVAQGEDHPALFSDGLRARELHWVAGTAPRAPFACAAKVRYRQTEQACTITALDGDGAQVEFKAAQRAVTPGQSIVFYDGEVCLGGGVIDRRLKAGGVSDKIAA